MSITDSADDTIRIPGGPDRAELRIFGGDVENCNRTPSFL